MKHLFLTLIPGLIISFSAFGQTGTPAISGKPVASVAGQPISEQELVEALGAQQWMQLRNQEYEAKSKALESLVRLKIVQEEARRRGVTAEKLIEQEVHSKIADPTDSEVEAFYWGQGQTGVLPADAKEQYRARLKALQQQKARQAYADSLRGRIEVAILLRPPSVEVEYDAARVKGAPDATVTIVEFSDFQCPYCKKTENTLNALLAKYEGKVKLAYMDFPLRDIHSQAASAAEAARCAGEQGKFWEYHDALFSESKLNRENLIGVGVKLSLDGAAFQACLDSGKFKTRIEADAAQGSKVGVAGTPAFFINGVFLSGAQPQAEFEKIIERELELAKGRRGGE